MVPLKTTVLHSRLDVCMLGSCVLPKPFAGMGWEHGSRNVPYLKFEVVNLELRSKMHFPSFSAFGALNDIEEDATILHHLHQPHPSQSLVSDFPEEYQEIVQHLRRRDSSTTTKRKGPEPTDIPS